MKLALLFLGLLGCAHTATVTNGATVKPDTSAVLALIGRFSMGHACPVAPDLILTAAHLLDIRPYDREYPALPYRYSDGLGNYGIVVPKMPMERCSDIAMGETNGTVRHYPRASFAPRAGERVWLVGYDWSSRSKAYGEKVIEARVLRIVAGHLIMDRSGEAGSSGSCVWNESGEVVAINTFGAQVAGSEVGGAVGIWGELLESCK